SSTTKSDSISTGISHSETDTSTFAEMIGLDVSTSAGFGPAKINATVKTSFTATQSKSITDAVTKTSTTSIANTVTPTDSTGSVAFQYWQLILYYETSGKQLIQNMPETAVSFEQRLYYGKAPHYPQERDSGR
ncbi:hypothetical protein, partial [Ilumatobacter sp.]|uniref:hypothetical protein n=1 Tax=Ilumatobacter sp. TaxID=1967498 RepID=UPI003C3CA2CB